MLTLPQRFCPCKYIEPFFAPSLGERWCGHADCPATKGHHVACIQVRLAALPLICVAFPCWCHERNQLSFSCYFVFFSMRLSQNCGQCKRLKKQKEKKERAALAPVSRLSAANARALRAENREARRSGRGVVEAVAAADAADAQVKLGPTSLLSLRRMR